MSRRKFLLLAIAFFALILTITIASVFAIKPQNKLEKRIDTRIQKTIVSPKSQFFRYIIKSDTYTDIVYAVDIEYSEENIELLREDYSFNEFDYRVVYKR